MFMSCQALQRSRDRLRRAGTLVWSACLAMGAATLQALAGSVEIPAWSFDRGNVRVFTTQWADGQPMVAFGGSSPVIVEYDFELPASGSYNLELVYAAGDARPVELLVDGKGMGSVCRSANGSWNTSQAQKEKSIALHLSAGRHTLRLQRPNDFPHVVALKIDSPALPQGFVLSRPNARKLAPGETRTLSFLQDADPVALRLAISDLTSTFGSEYPEGPNFLERLDAIEAKLKDPTLAVKAKAKLRFLQREALLANPLLNFDRLLVLRRGFPDAKAARGAMGAALGVGSLNAHTSDDTPRQGHWKDEMTLLSHLRGEPVVTTLYRAPQGETLIDPVLHFDGDHLLLAKNGETEKNWRLWEMSVSSQGCRQITPDEGADVGHFDPCYLPDGRIVFASTAVYQGLPCEFGAQAMTCLYLLNRTDGTVRQLTFEQDSDWCPTMLPSGRVLYQRWEYTDQSHANSRILFHMNPDGTDQREFRGSGSWFPGSFFYARAIPGEPHQVIGIATGHHGTPRSGRLLILDPSRGRRDGEGIVREVPGRGQIVEPIVRDRLADGVWPQFLMPWPLSAKYYLVAAKPQPNSLWGIYLVDCFDNATLIKKTEGEALLWPIPLQKTPQPPVIPDRVNLASNESTVFISDIYRGPGLHGVPRGTVKQLRVIEYYFSRRGFGGLYGTLGLDGPWDAKRIVGTVPVHPDGSAFFKIPANTPLSLQPLDRSGQALQLMRSWFVGGPGEAVSCSGCHESQAEVSLNKPSLAAREAPMAIQPWHGPVRGFGFVREVQPVLDKYCVRCHDGHSPSTQPVEGRPGGVPLPNAVAMASGGLPPYLKGDLPLTNWSSQLAGRWTGGGSFTEAYYQLQRYVRRPGIEGDRRMLTPLEFHFNTTELGQLLGKGHHGVTLDAEAWQRLAAWADLNAPFYGTWGEIPQFCRELEGSRKLATVNARAMELRRLHVPMGPHPDYDAIPETPPYDTTPVVPNPEERRAEETRSCEGWPFDPATAQARQQAAAVAGNLTLSLDLNGVNLELARIPGGRFVMGSTNGLPDEAPVAVVEVQPFWMGRYEVANRQFRQFASEHESRTEDRHGYQFGVVGYDEDQPDQPAVRVSWDEATAFCRWVSERTGRHVSLPTEAQWEWASRAGAETPFWFGGLDVDYSSFANLGDKKLAEFAADTSLDDYSAARPMVNPNRYDDWIPRDDRFDDGGLVTVSIGQYRPNPWGLSDMHGNAWEWTRSAYRPYPYLDRDGRNDLGSVTAARVARGGSWYDRPKRATSSYRLAYPPWQRVFNVGFRIICEDSVSQAAAR